LTINDVQAGDTVKQIDTGILYVVVSTDNLSNETGYVEFMAGTAARVPWSGVQDKPTDLSGYGITNAYTKTEADNRITELLTKDGIMSAEVAILSAMTHLPSSVIEGNLENRYYGRTLVNLLGNCGNFETDSNSDGVADEFIAGLQGIYSLSTTSVKYGAKAQRIDAIAGDTVSNNRYVLSSQGYNVSNGKYYIALVDFSNDGTCAGSISNVIDNIIGNNKTSAQTMYLKFSSTSDHIVKFALYNRQTAGSTGYVQYDGLRIYEISQAEYNAIDTMTEQQIAEKYPYVDSATSCVSARVKSVGKNLANPNNLIVGTKYNDGIIDVSRISSYSLVNNVLTCTSTGWAGIGFKTKCKPSTSYVFSYIPVITTPANARASVNFYTKDGTYISSITDSLGLLSKSFTTPSNCDYFIWVYTETAASTFVISNIQIGLGSTATTFESYKETTQYLPTMRSIGTTKDEIYENKHIKRVSDTVVLDGSLGWLLDGDNTGLKTIKLSTYFLGSISHSEIVIKYSGLPLKGTSVMGNSPDSVALFSSGTLSIDIADVDSGWLDTWTNSTVFTGLTWQQLIKCLMNGWKLTTANTDVAGCTWTGILSGTTKSDSAGLTYCLTNKDTGWTGWATLIYALANPVITDIIQSEMIAEPYGSILVEPAFRKTLTNSSGTVALPYKVSSLESVQKLVNGEYVNVTYTLSTDKLSFTTTDTASDFIVTGVLDYQSVLPDVSYSYPLNVAGAIAGINEQIAEISAVLRALTLKVMGV
jgi:hypothetical protein